MNFVYAVDEININKCSDTQSTDTVAGLVTTQKLLLWPLGLKRQTVNNMEE